MDKPINDKLDSFFSQFKKQQYKQGEILIRADDNPSGIYYLKNGNVKVYVITKNGDELVLNIFKPISFFPMSWAINNRPNMYFYEALNDVEVWKAPKEAVLQYVKDNPDILYDLLSRVYSGMDGLLMRMSYLMSSSAHARLLAEIIIYVKRFHKADLSNGNKVEVTITEKELATLTGLTRETVSRELKVLKNKGLITFARKALTVLDIHQLESELADIS